MDIQSKNINIHQFPEKLKLDANHLKETHSTSRTPRIHHVKEKHIWNERRKYKLQHF